MELPQTQPPKMASDPDCQPASAEPSNIKMTGTAEVNGNLTADAALVNESPVESSSSKALCLQELGNVSVSTDSPKMLHDLKARVEKKEEAVGKALESLARIHQQIEKAEEDHTDRDYSQWLDLYESLIEDLSAFDFLVGVAGDTGMGKTSLLNALVCGRGGGGIAPSSQSAACTAAVCCFRYLQPRKGEEKFKLRVHLKSKETVDQEIATIFEEIRQYREYAKNEGAKDSETQAEEQRLNDQLRIISLWSGVSKQELEAYVETGRVGDITSKCSASQYFNLKSPQHAETLEISCPSERSFSDTIKRYVASNSRQKQGAAVWPIVEMVDIFLPADILKNGVVLVDLPGEMDAVESRSRVARDFYIKLDRLMVVSPCERATDNRTAIELLRPDRVIDLDADGKLEPGCLAVVITKIDLMNWLAYADEISGDDEGNESGSSAFKEIFGLREDYKSKTEKLDKLNDTIEQLEQNSDSHSNSDQDNAGDDTIYTASSAQGHVRDPLSRTRGAELKVKYKEQNEREENDPNDLRRPCQDRAKIEEKLKELDQAGLRACIDFRSQRHKKEFQNHLDIMRNNILAKKRHKVTTDVGFFPISSTAYQNLQKKQPMDGFPDEQATGFVDLKDWIVRQSLPERERQATARLAKAQLLLDAVDGWIMEKDMANFRLPEDSHHGIMEYLKTTKRQLQEDLKFVLGKVRGCRVGQSLRRDLSDRNPPTKETFVPHVKQYKMHIAGNKMHWSTYAACINRYGGLFKSSSKPRREHCWQDKTSMFFWQPHHRSWVKAYNTTLPNHSSKIQIALHIAISKHIEAVLSTTELPQKFREAMRPKAYKIHNVLQSHVSVFRGIIQDLKNQVRMTRLSSKTWINEPMNDGYKAAREITGPKKFERQSAIMTSHAEKAADEIFGNVSVKIMEKLKARHKEYNESFKKISDKLLSQVANEEEHVAKVVCGKGKKNLQKKTQSAIEDSDKVFDTEIKAWRQYWQTASAQLPPEISLLPDLYDEEDDEDEQPRKHHKDEDESEDDAPLAKKVKTAKKTGPKTPTKRAPKTGIDGSKETKPRRKITKKAANKNALENSNIITNPSTAPDSQNANGISSTQPGHRSMVQSQDQSADAVPGNLSAESEISGDEANKAVDQSAAE